MESIWISSSVLACIVKLGTMGKIFQDKSDVKIEKPISSLFCLLFFTCKALSDVIYKIQMKTMF